MASWTQPFTASILSSVASPVRTVNVGEAKAHSLLAPQAPVLLNHQD